MQKHDGVSKNNFLKIIIIILLVANVAIIATKFSNANKEEKPKDKYYTGAILKPNHSANLVDYVDKKNNVVISPININSSINQLYNLEISNDKIENYLKLTLEESNNLEIENQEILTITNKEETSLDELYLTLTTNLNTYKDYTTTDIEDLTIEQRDNLILLLTKINKTYEAIKGKSNNTVKFINNYKLTPEEHKINDYAIYELLIECLDNYETYTYNSKINNFTETIYNEELAKKQSKKKKNKLPATKVKLSGISYLDTKEATKEINSKIKANTNNKIKYIVDNEDINSNELIQINSFNFESLWNVNFDKKYIWDSEWKTFDNKIEIVEMLHDQLDYYYENEYAYAFNKTFEDNKFEFVAILPKEHKNFDLSNLNIEGLLDHKINKEVSISIPKFTLQYETNLGELYTKLGIDTEKTITLDNLTEEVTLKLLVSKTTITIDEKGTNNSNIRSSQLETKDLTDTEHHIFLDRPFAFLIREVNTNKVLLIGKVTNPNSK